MGAKNRNIEFKITKKYAYSVLEKQKYLCVYTNISLNFNLTSKDRFGNASLDRIDSSKGYIEGNIQWVHKKINIMKNDLNHNSFIKACATITRNARKNGWALY